VGTQWTIWGSFLLAGFGLPLLLLPRIPAVLVGMVLVGIGMLFAQAAATGFVSKAATVDRGSASGIYLACYFFGGMVGTAVLGQVFDRFGWARRGGRHRRRAYRRLAACLTIAVN
jgi:sugar phosphate permease